MPHGRLREPPLELDASKGERDWEGDTSMSPANRKPVVDEEAVAPVTILDGLGRVIHTVPAEEFRRTHGVPELSRTEHWRRKRARVKTTAGEEGALESLRT